MITIRRSGERGQADHGWLRARHSFSFGGYHDPRHMGFRSLRVLNDDIIAGGGGFPTHPHRDMEILTYVLSGALEHRDSMGNGRVIRAGDFQYMAAGSGVEHSEFNPSPIEPVHLLQIWIRPDRHGVPPRYAERPMAGATPGRLHLVASSEGRDGSIALHQDADVWLARLRAGDFLEHPVRPGRGVWVHVAEGSATVNGEALTGGDAMAVEDEPGVTLVGQGPSRVLLFDLAAPTPSRP